jgi:rubrerythrin
MPQPIRTVEEFYAHALAIEREAAERYEEFVGYFEERDAALGALCKKLAVLEREHFEELAGACAALELPVIPESDYRWLASGPAESSAREVFYRIATPSHLLEIALDAERRAREFFVHVARTAPIRAVQELASVMAAEEAEHAEWVSRALEQLRRGRINAD